VSQLDAMAIPDGKAVVSIFTLALAALVSAEQIGNALLRREVRIFIGGIGRRRFLCTVSCGRHEHDDKESKRHSELGQT